MKKVLSRKKRIFIGLLALLLALCSAAAFTALAVSSKMLPSQRAAERWQGESPMDYSQVSAYMSADSPMSYQQVFEFRLAMLERYKAASVETEDPDSLFVDAWSSTGKLNVSSGLGKGTVSVCAVGGNFFDFHPIRLISGSYIRPDELMKDRVLLDEDCAWLLFGGTDLQGLEMRIEGRPFVVAGVIEREQDFASKRAYSAGMGIYMSFEAYSAIKENAGIGCYEYCMAQPVEGFAMSFAKDKFPVKGADLIENTHRFNVGRLFRLLGQFGSRSMQTMGMSYPYWENAARCLEDFCLLYLFTGMVTAVFPLLLILLIIIKYLKKGKNKLSEELVPQAVEKTREAVRVRQRRRWEKKHGMHEKNK